MRTTEKKFYYYRVYGLNIKSEIEITEFSTRNYIAEEEWISIIYGQTTKDIKEYIEKGKNTQVTKEYVWFHIRNVATYYIEKGEKVIVSPYAEANFQLLKTYIMCSCLGFIMLQRNQVAIHGGVIEVNHNAIIVAGERGAGKSTLTTALRMKGYQFLSDDIAATKNDDVPRVFSGFPYQKLCEDVVSHMNYAKEDYISFRGDDQVKYMIPVVEGFIEGDKPLKVVVEICKDEVDEVQIKEIKGQDKLLHMMKHIYRGEYIWQIGELSPGYFKQCVEIAKNIRFYKLTRPQEGFTVEEQIRLIEQVVS